MTDFDTQTWLPMVVEPISPKYYNIKTQTDGFKSTVRNLDATALNSWRLRHIVKTTVGSPKRSDLLSHFQGQTGEATSFKWLNPPSYLGLSSSLTVRYTSFKDIPMEGSLWRVEFDFEEVP